ncbi:2-oxo acid dehydrogenase subunit E2 [Salicibibacter kimchii]|uniref:Dihydrolipoamide acetyltransferase component of pyruvate dehydrogenase complex n=1 Tax=Salicibibacter kimchii TaxID=2099786 RepID=A0A345C1E7_9BACI|nr:2-oxo acid dehydrogenase subunit E2 [Salicibibacter kimchii]AXF57028.1 hypothetical protein DT065_14145 [Salicibibacter kimchii]
MVDVKLHDIGEGMHEAEVLRFLVDTGESVETDAPLVEIQTDKMTAELTAPSKGVVSNIEANVGDVIEVGDTILKIDEPGEALNETPEPVASSKEPTPSFGESLQQKSPAPPWKLASPYTRKIARDNDVDMAQVGGTGPAGRVMDEDVYNYIKQATTPQMDTSHTTSSSNDTVTNTKQEPTAERQIREILPLTQTPSGIHTEEMDFTKLLKLEKEWGISLHSFIIKAAQVALKAYPSLNALIDEAEAKVHFASDCHISVTQPHMEPKVIPNVDQSSILNIEKPSSNGEHDRNYTFAIHHLENESDIGSISDEDPQTGMLFFSPVQEKAAVYHQEITVRSMADTTLLFDPRAVTGLTAIAFCRRLKQFIENPNLLTLELI